MVWGLLGLMLRKVRLLCVAAVAAAALAPTASHAATTQVTVSATIRKPLEFTLKGDLNFGTILFTGSGTFSAVVKVDQNGVRTCPATYFTCSGTTSAAIYNASGNKQSPVVISTPPTVTLTSPNGTITMTVDAPTSLVLTNSGYPGTDFGVGGSLQLSDATKEGVYTGTLAVTADYQ